MKCDNQSELHKERIACWIHDLWADDPYRHYLMSTPVEVNDAVLVDDRTIQVQYEFWDDECHVSDDQRNFMFDIEIGKEYGENFPTHLTHVLHTVRYTWKTPDDRITLSHNLEDEDLIEQEIVYCGWDDPSISNELIDLFFLFNNPEFLRAMLLEKYDAANGLPTFIPERLVPYFTKIITG